MAEIPIEKKSSMAWLWWLLALVLVGLLLWWLLSSNDERDATPVVEDTAVTQPAAVGAAGAAATTYAIGDSVSLDNVRVTSLVGDMAFNADVAGEPMLVIFDEQRTPNTATEGRYDINPGNMVNFTGTVRAASEPLPQGVTADIPAGTDKYIFAETISKVGA